MTVLTEESRGGLFRCRWFLVSEKDWDTIAPKGVIGANINEFYQACSAQNIFFPEGVLSKYHNMMKKIDSIGSQSPTAEEIANVEILEESCKVFYDKSIVDNVWSFGINKAYDSYIDIEGYVAVFILKMKYTFFSFKNSRLDDFFECIRQLSNIQQSVSEEISSIPKYFRPMVIDLLSLGLLKDQPGFRRVPLKEDRITYIGHAGLSIKTDQTLLLVDPLFHHSENTTQEYVDYMISMIKNCDAILISHAHWDHLNYQTLTYADPNTKILIPQVSKPSYTNPDIKAYLKWLGFTNFLELEDWGQYMQAKIRITAVPFYGETFGLDSHFDALTYLIEQDDLCLFGTVDACFDEAGDMTSVMEVVSTKYDVDVFFVGCTGQSHKKIYRAPGPRRISNEMINHPKLQRYHANNAEAKLWVEKIMPRLTVSYADFDFSSVLCETNKLNSKVDLGLALQDSISTSELKIKEKVSIFSYVQ